MRFWGREARVSADVGRSWLLEPVVRFFRGGAFGRPYHGPDGPWRRTLPPVWCLKVARVLLWGGAVCRRIACPEFWGGKILGAFFVGGGGVPYPQGVGWGFGLRVGFDLTTSKLFRINHLGSIGSAPQSALHRKAQAQKKPTAIVAVGSDADLT